MDNLEGVYFHVIFIICYVYQFFMRTSKYNYTLFMFYFKMVLARIKCYAQFKAT